MTVALENRVLALPLEEAVSLLEKSGLQVEIRRTGPPRAMDSEGRERVLRLQFRDQAVVVTAAREILHSSGGKPESRSQNSE